MKLDFTDKERAAFNAFSQKHFNCMTKGRKKYRGAFSMNILMRGSGIGPVTIVKCCHCGGRENITDYDSW